MEHFKRNYESLLQVIEDCQGHFLLLLKACNEGHDFRIMQYHYSQSNELSKEISRLYSKLMFSVSTAEKEKKGQFFEQYALLAVINKYQDQLMCRAMEAIRPYILANQALVETPD